MVCFKFKFQCYIRLKYLHSNLFCITSTNIVDRIIRKLTKIKKLKVRILISTTDQRDKNNTLESEIETYNPK